MPCIQPQTVFTLGAVETGIWFFIKWSKCHIKNQKLKINSALKLEMELKFLIFEINFYWLKNHYLIFDAHA